MGANHRNFRDGKVDPALFGAEVEHDMKNFIRELRNRFWLFRVELKWQAMRPIDPLVLALTPRQSTTGDVVIVRLDAIGDFVLWLDAAKELRRIYPGRKITLLGNAIWADLAKRLPYWDEVWPVNTVQLKRLSLYRVGLLRAIHRRGFETAIQPTYSREFLLGEALIRASGARDRIGSVGDCLHMTAREKTIADRWYTRQLPSSPKAMMELERNAEFIRLLGRPDYVAACPTMPPLGRLPEKLQLAHPYLIVFPGASASYRQWPVDRFVDMANQLCNKMGLMAVVCGSAGEAMLCQRVADGIKVEVLNLAGQTSLPEFVELVRGARLLIGNETSAVHIAATVGRPAVCILGGGHFGRFVPYIEAAGCRAPQPAMHQMPCYGCNWRCTQPHVAGEPVPCISGVTIENVLLASERALAMESPS